MFIDFEEEYNCTLIAIYENGSMTLRQIGDRLGISFARVKQIETIALGKMKGNSLIS
jgi:DNA-directed RNA polymerase sigma subunit (sigma70/sigma32)